MGERRGAIRQKSFLRGCVYFNRRRGAVDCLIRDISDSGARIIFSDAVNVPDVVELYIPQQERTVRARVQWRHGAEIGLAFPSAGRPGMAPQPADVMQRLEYLEAEVLSLRRMLKRLKAGIAAAEDDRDVA